MQHTRRRFSRLFVGLVALIIPVAAACSSTSSQGPSSSASSGGSTSGSGSSASGGSSTAASSGTGQSSTGGPSGSAATGAGSSSSSPSGAGTPGGSLTVALSVEPDSLDPGAASQSASIQISHEIYDTLVYLDPATGKYVPGLATSWATSTDGKTVTFTLRTGVKFQDGTDFNAEAVKFTMDRIVSPNYKSPLAKAKLGPLTGVKAVDAQTVEFDLSAPFPSLLNGLSQGNLAIVSPTAVQKYGDQYGQHPVGTGPYSFVEWVPGDHITIKKNPDYNWAPSVMQHQGPGYLDQIVFKVVTDNSARTAALQSGDVQLAWNMPAADYSRLKGAGGDLTMQAAPWSGGSLSWFLNTEKSPTNDLAVRQAIEYGLDRKTLIDTALFGNYTPAEGPISPSTLYYSKAVEGMYPYDTAKAASLLDGAGWTMGSDGYRHKGNEKLSLHIITIAQFEPIGTTIQGLLKPLGFDVAVDVRDQAAAVTADSAGEGNGGITGLVDSDPAAIQLFYSSTNYGGYDWSRIKDDGIDKLLAEQATETDDSKRAELFSQLQVTIMQKALIYPMYQGAFLWGINNKVKGFHTDILAYPAYYDIYLGS